MSEVLFIRHARTGLAGAFCGHTDPPVDDVGDRQIVELVDALKDEGIDVIYSSDLLRARTTAQALARSHAADCIELPKLREIHFGDWEGLGWVQIEQSDPDYARRWVDEFPGLAAPNGEAFKDFEERACAACTDLLALGEARRLAVVTHAGVLRVAFRRLCGLSEEQTWDETKEYCGITHIDSARGKDGLHRFSRRLARDERCSA